MTKFFTMAMLVNQSDVRQGRVILTSACEGLESMLTSAIPSLIASEVKAR